MVPASELTTSRADMASAILDLSCTIQRKTRTSDGQGQSSETWSTIATVNAAMAQPSAGQLQNYDYLIGSLATWQVRLPYGTSVQPQDRLVISGQTLTVQVLLTPRTYATLLTVLASEVK